MWEFFKDKTSQLKEARNNADLNCGRGKPFAAILTETLETSIRQLGEMEVFFPIIDSATQALMRYPRTPIVKVRAQTVKLLTPY